VVCRSRLGDAAAHSPRPRRVVTGERNKAVSIIAPPGIYAGNNAVNGNGFGETFGTITPIGLM